MWFVFIYLLIVHKKKLQISFPPLPILPTTEYTLSAYVSDVLIVASYHPSYEDDS